MTSLDYAAAAPPRQSSPSMHEDDPHARQPLQLDVTAWSVEHSNRLIEGTTVELGGDGALLRLAGVGPAEVRLDLRIALPNRGLFTPATVVRREPPDLVEVAFDWVDVYERGRLRAFVRNTP